MEDNLVFTTKPKEVPVQIDGKSYVLREATSEAACEYRNALIRSSLVDVEGGEVKIKGLSGIAEVEPLLVSLCLYDEKGNRVPLNVVKRWPARVVTRLYEVAKKISGLDEEVSEEQKKGL